ncbi:hypothetical protein ACVWVZ_000141 [Pseudomonas tolaasii]
MTSTNTRGGRYQTLSISSQSLLSAGILGELQHREMLGELLLTDHQTNGHSRIARETIFERPDVLDKSLHEFIMHSCIDNDSIRAHAYPTFLQESSDDSVTNSMLHVGIITLPPSSNTTRFIRGSVIARAPTRLPTRVEPVNEIILGTGCKVNTSPISSAGLMTTLTRPAGSPASSKIFASSNPPVTGVYTAGLTTTAFSSAHAAPLTAGFDREGSFKG